MTDNIISYIDMCQREKASLQQGMNFGLGKTHSVILMSVRPNAPYNDRIEDNGSTLIYEGHNQPKSASYPNPKLIDQPEKSFKGTLTQNGKFHKAAQDYKINDRPAERVRVYEKIKPGIWAYNGLFLLTDSWIEIIDNRQVFKFKLNAIDGEDGGSPATLIARNSQRRRIIPTHIKLEVWQRDGGKCAMCQATDELHFDHILPFAKGGTSMTAENVQLLCARHNLSKSDKIL